MVTPDTSEEKILLDRAFEPGPLVHVDVTNVQRLYVQKGLSGDTDPDPLNQKFLILVDEVTRLCGAVELVQEDWQTENLKRFSHSFTGRSYFQNDNFYEHIQHNLEVIISQLLGLESIDKKKSVLKDLLANIGLCGPGIFQHMESAKIELLSDNTIEICLAKLRRTIIQQIAEIHIERKGISSNNSIHAINVFLIYANEQGWKPYGYESLSEFKENFQSLAVVDSEDLIWFHEEFLNRYHPETIITEIATYLRNMIIERFNKEPVENRPIKIGGAEDWGNLFPNFPFMHDPPIRVLFETFHEFEEQNNSEGPPCITYQGISLYLRSHTEMIPLLINYFIAEERLFFTHKNITVPIHEKEKSITLRLIPNSPTLNYVCEKDGSFSPLYNNELLKTNVLEMELEKFKRYKISLHQGQFDFFIQKQETDFSGCILDGINFTEYSIDSLKLDKTELRNATLTKEQCNKFRKRKATVSFTGETKIETSEEKPCNNTSKRWSISPYREMNENDELLFFAVSKNIPQLVSIVLEAGAHPSKKNEEGKKPIQLAAEAHFWDCVRILAQNKKEKNNVFDYGAALIFAAKANKIDIVKILIDSGAKLSWTVRPDRMSALYFAAENGHAEMVHLLLQSGADPYQESRNLSTPLQIAAKMHHWHCVKIFVEQCPRNPEMAFYCGSVLLSAAKANNLEIVNLMIRIGAHPSWHYTDFCMGPLHFAAENTNAQMVVSLLKAGLNPNCSIRNKKTPIEICVEKDDVACLVAFSDHQKSKNATFNATELLILAVRGNRTEVTKKLIELEKESLANPGAHSRISALAYFSKNGEAEMVNRLLGAGATAYQELPMEHGFWRRLFRLKRRYTNAIDLAAKAGEWACVRALLLGDSNQIPHCKTGNFNPTFTLSLAMKAKKISIVKILNEKTEISEVTSKQAVGLSDKKYYASWPAFFSNRHRQQQPSCKQSDPAYREGPSPSSQTPRLF